MLFWRLYLFIATVLLTKTIRLTEAQAGVGLSVINHDLTVLVNANESFEIQSGTIFDYDVSVTLLNPHEEMIDLHPESFTYPKQVQGQTQRIVVTGRKAGHVVITARSTPAESWITDSLFMRIVVAKSRSIIYASLVFGWIYFVAWSVSFYPQIYENFRRKSVEGLNFDFIALNLFGFTLYSLFNCGLYFNEGIQDEYAKRHPRGINPVMLNDVFFGLHAIFATSITIAQCFFYHRANQRISKVAYGLLTLFAVFVIISAGLAGGSVIHWLDFLYYCSYVKLAITIIKYIPQAIMNYRRKSTAGWSIGNILLDFTGGTLSMLQMLLNAHNYDDWESIFGDPTKFGLGLFSVLFDIFFMLQHYVFYRHAADTARSNQTIDTEIPNNEKETAEKY
ncbi:CG17119 [Drosophila busckii]|uniref:CG17119 n=1 Tax=Drosophila busckii TaxID=30019 RepID=A0A0M4EPK6_DROBS|nr:cystinosin homolog [Drosophila busckii]ALC46072.1 CG17119 [Drosophila busckii]